jgi:hypothetical protein
VTKGRKVWRRILWIAVFVGLTVIQIGTLYQLDQFLKPPSLEAKSASALSDGTESEDQTVKVPDEAIQHVFTPDHLRVAYATENDELVVESKEGVDFREEVGTIKYMKWLGTSNTLLYMVEHKRTQEMYLFQMHHEKPLLIHEWSEKKREVENVFFSPYLEFFYVHMKNDERDELYKYTAGSGLNKVPTNGMTIDHIDYDEKNDIVYITNSKGKIWEYKDERLRRSTLKVPKLS